MMCVCVCVCVHLLFANEKAITNTNTNVQTNEQKKEMLSVHSESFKSKQFSELNCENALRIKHSLTHSRTPIHAYFFFFFVIKP